MVSRVLEVLAGGAPRPQDRHRFVSVGQAKLHQLAEGLEVGENQLQMALSTFDLLTSPWGSWEVGENPRWPSDITDDHSPFEFSVALSPKGVDLRLLVEAQRSPMGLEEGWQAALDLNQRIAGEPGVSLDRFEQIRDLFAPDARFPARFALWHSAVIQAGCLPWYKVYLNPQLFGGAAAPGLVQEAFRRLGLSSAWNEVRRLLAARPVDNEALYVSLDLMASAAARVKVYIAHRGTTADDFEDQLAGLASYQPGRATKFIQEVLESGGPYRERPLLSCLNFKGSEPPGVTLHAPVRCYVGSDQVSLDRVTPLLHPEQARRLALALNALSDSPLSDSRGLITYVSESMVGEARRLVLYLAPQLYQFRQPVLDQVPSVAAAG